MALPSLLLPQPLPPVLLRLEVVLSLLFSKLDSVSAVMFFVMLMLCTQRNIVATVNLDCRLDLKTIALHARNAEYSEYTWCLRDTLDGNSH